MSWLQRKKIVSKCCPLILCNNSEPFFNRIVTCDEKLILYDNQQWPAQWLDREETPKHFPKSNLHQNKVMVTVSWSAACLTHYSFLSPSEIITSEKYAQQIDEIHWKLQCLQAGIAQQMGQFFSITVPTACHTTNTSKVGQIGYEVLSHPPYSPDLLPIDYHFFKHFDNFLQGKCFHNQTEAGNASQEFVESWSMDFYATGMNLFLIGKNVLLVMFPILMNKDVFEPGYNDLKFMVPNCNYICNNLMQLHLQQTVAEIISPVWISLLSLGRKWAEYHTLTFYGLVTNQLTDWLNRPWTS